MKKKQGFPRLLQVVGRRRNQVIAACILAVISSAARMVPFFTIYMVIRELLPYIGGFGEITTDNLYALAAVTCIAALLYGVSGFLSSSLAHKAAYNILYELRVQLMEKLARVSAGFFSGTTLGELKKIISDDVEGVELFIAHHLTDTVTALTLPIFTLIYLFAIDWRLALVTVIPIAAAVLLMRSIMKNPSSAKMQKEIHRAHGNLNSTIIEYVNGMPVIKVFNRTLSAFERFEEAAGGLVDAVTRTAKFFARRIGGYRTALGIQLLFILPAALYLSVRAHSYIDFLPVVLLFFLAGTGLREPLDMMISMAVSSGEIKVGMARIDSVLLEKEITEPKDGKEPEGYDISFENVSFSYDAEYQQALTDVSFYLKQGQITGLVGPSGGGKSTAAGLLLRFYEPQKGSIKIGGVDIREIAPRRLAELVGYVFQNPRLFEDTVEGNIRMGNQAASRRQVEAAAQAAGIHEVIMALPKGYDTVVGGRHTWLSGGEVQRIAIARVFLKDAPIILLDEATAYADAENERRIQESFARLAAGKTVLVIAHRLKTIQRADNILVLNEGKLAHQGTHDVLLSHCDLYRNMVDANENREHWQIKMKRKGEKHNAAI